MGPAHPKVLDFHGIRLSRFLTYFLMGFINFWGDDHAYEIALGMSFGWEFMEILFGKTTGALKFFTSGGMTEQVQDIMMNMVGFHAGREVREFMPCRIKYCARKI